MIQELYISFNEVSDVSVAAMLSSLQVLDMERYVVCVYVWYVCATLLSGDAIQ